jgi:hypothetical protein
VLAARAVSRTNILSVDVCINVFIDPYNSASNKQSTAFKEIQAKLSES